MEILLRLVHGRKWIGVYAKKNKNKTKILITIFVVSSSLGGK